MIVQTSQQQPKTAPYSVAGYWRVLLGAGAFLFTSIAVLISATYLLGILNRTAIFSGDDVVAQSGYAYTVKLQKLFPEGALCEIVYPADSKNWPTISSLEVREDGRPLSPAHTLHVDIVARESAGILIGTVT